MYKLTISKYFNLKFINNKKYIFYVNSCSKIHEKVYPYGIFQERILNFSEYYSFTGKYLSKKIYDSITPFDNKLIVLEI